MAAVALTNGACLSGLLGGSPAQDARESTIFRKIRADDVSVPAGYHLEVVAAGLTAPVAVVFDDMGRVYVLESGDSTEDARPPRLLEVGQGGALRTVATGAGSMGAVGAGSADLARAPWTGITWHEGAFFVAASGARDGAGQILRVSLAGEVVPIVSDLPTVGDHPASGPVVGPDGLLYFGIGSATNAGVVGEDNVDRGWVRRFPAFHDVPCKNLSLMGDNYRTPNTLGGTAGQESTTGGLVAFGERVDAGENIRGQVPCTGAILRVRPAGGAPELVAWGLRDPFGLAFTPDGRLVATDTGMQPRGSRPVKNAPDVLWLIEPGRWYGFPDFAAGEPVWQSPQSPQLPQSPEERLLERPPRLLATHPGLPPTPAARFGPRSTPGRLDFSRSAAFGYVGEAFVAQAGEPALDTGAQVVRVALDTGVVTPFAVNRAAPGPASRGDNGGLERPIDARFDPHGQALYVVDRGLVEGQAHRLVAGSGVLWRVVRSTPAEPSPVALHIAPASTSTGAADDAPVAPAVTPRDGNALCGPAADAPPIVAAHDTPNDAPVQCVPASVPEPAAVSPAPAAPGSSPTPDDPGMPHSINRGGSGRGGLVRASPGWR
ncbi:PQQ-dependent sugar dehydrogenase [Chondromyces apiculatus]|uniref:PQQ-dependent sugar dehydrogenase n=1 Tax=Chondromyces apiculatus TaxID=51 RepID=UPI000694CF1F|nr:PQQ-dependent sugar dehydrogenase [Chondromyces apiculatus]